MEIRGIWWPEGQGDAVPGTLRYAEGQQPELSLDGGFRPNHETPPGIPFVILGRTSDGREVTLAECQLRSGSINLGLATSSARYSVRFTIIGAHASPWSAARFRELSIHFDHADPWARITGFNQRILSLKEFELTYKIPDPVNVDVHGAVIRLSVEMIQSGDRLTTVELNQRTLFTIIPDTPASIDHLLELYAYPIQRFLTFGVGIAVHPIAAHAQLASSSTNRAWSIQIGDWMRPKPAKLVESPFMLFSFGDIETNYSSALRAWLEFKDDLGPSLDLYFQTVFATEMYRSGRFLNFVQALEVYHRRRHGGVYLDQVAFDELRDEIDAAIRQKVQSRAVAEALAGRTQYWNEWSLRRRIKDVLNHCGPWTSSLIDDHQAFAHRVAQTRNFLTHFSPEDKGGAASGSDLYLLGERVRFILEGCLLREMLLPDELVADLMIDNQHYLWLRSVTQRRQRS